MRLIPIPEDKYDEYRLCAVFDCYKWDPQFKDNNTLAKYALVLTKEEYDELVFLTESIDKETVSAEEYLNVNLDKAKPLALSKKLNKQIRSMSNYDKTKHVRLMRYDFHPTVEGKWAVSEVNSDVPGGFAEATLLPKLAIDTLELNNHSYVPFGDILAESIKNKTRAGGNIMMVHCTCFSDDRQVMQYLGDKLSSLGFNVIYGAADHIRFKNKVAYSILSGNECELDGIVRFNPLEWVTKLKPNYWNGYFNTVTMSCNHPIAIFAQTKRFPFVWDNLENAGISMKYWRDLLPDTKLIKDYNKLEDKSEYIFKPVYGRVGEKISIKEACGKGEYEKILKDVKKHPNRYLAQKKFLSMPLEGINGETYHLGLGSYTVDGKHAGFYARISNVPRIDSNAADIPVLIEGSIF